jgi:hypothetical protein
MEHLAETFPVVCRWRDVEEFIDQIVLAIREAR